MEGKDIALLAVVGVVAVVLLRRQQAIAPAYPTPPAQLYPVSQLAQGGTQTSEYAGYGQLAAGIGQGLGSLFTGIGGLVQSANQGNY